MKKTLAILLAVLMIVAFSACGKEPAPSASPDNSQAPEQSQAPAEDEEVTIEFANYAILEAGYEPFWTGVKEGFEAEHPNIKIDYVTAPYGEIVNQVLNMAAGGETVDLCFGEIGWTPTFQSAGLSVPIDTVMDEDFINDIYPSVLEAMKIDDKPYAVPMITTAYVLYYNKDLFEQAGLDPDTPPTTYDEALTMAEELSKLTTPDGNKVYAFGQTTASVPVSGSSITSMIYNFGGRLLTADGTLDADTPAFKDAISMIKLLDDKGYNPQNAKLKDLRNLFALGQLAMYYDQSWGFNGVSSINPDAKDFTASAMPLKGGDGSGESILQAATFFLMDNGPAQTDAVRQLVEYIVSPERLNQYIEITPAYPAMQSMSDLDAVVNSPILAGASGSLDKTVPSPFIPTLSDLNLELCSLAQAVTVGDEDVDTAIADFKDSANAVIAQ